MANDLDTCLCGLAQLADKNTSQITALIDLMENMLVATKTTIQLFNFDLEDEIRKLALQAILEVARSQLSLLEAPFISVQAMTRTLSDCPPVANFSQIMKNVRDVVTGDLREAIYEGEQLEAAINDKAVEIETLDRWIQSLRDFKDNLELCGT